MCTASSFNKSFDLLVTSSQLTVINSGAQREIKGEERKKERGQVCSFFFRRFSLCATGPVLKGNLSARVYVGDADGSWKRTFRVLGAYCLPDFYTTQL